MLSCERATALFPQSLDRDLTFRERLSLRMHLAMCKLCRRFARQLAFMRLVGSKVRDGDVSDLRLDAEAKERIRRRIDRNLGGP